MRTLKNPRALELALNTVVVLVVLLLVLLVVVSFFLGATSRIFKPVAELISSKSEELGAEAETSSFISILAHSENYFKGLSFQ